MLNLSLILLFGDIGTLPAWAVLGVILFVIYFWVKVSTDFEYQKIESSLNEALSALDGNWIVIKGGARINQQEFYSSVVAHYDPYARPFVISQNELFTIWLFESAGWWTRRSIVKNATVAVVKIVTLDLAKFDCVNPRLFNPQFSYRNILKLKSAQKWAYDGKELDDENAHTLDVMKRVCKMVGDQCFMIEAKNDCIAFFQEQASDVNRFYRLASMTQSIAKRLSDSHS